MTDDKSVSDDRLREIISLHQGNNVLWPPHVVTGEVLSMASELLSRRSHPSGYRLVPVEPTEGDTHPASPPVGGAVKVKPLEWTDDSANGLTTRHALSPIGEYRVGRADDGTWYWALGYGGSPPYVATEDAAKAAAQADYETRILSALEPPASDRGAVAHGLQLAAKWHDQRAHDTPDAFETEFHQVSAAAIRKLSEVSHEH